MRASQAIWIPYKQQLMLFNEGMATCMQTSHTHDITLMTGDQFGFDQIFFLDVTTGTCPKDGNFFNLAEYSLEFNDNAALKDVDSWQTAW